MNINTENMGELAAEMRARGASTRLVIKAGGKDYCGDATLEDGEGELVLSFDPPKKTATKKKAKK